jgi:hypothetical protein
MKSKLNEKGQLTLEFMLACILIVTVSTLLGILTFTLTITEVLQYVTYAGARSYLAGDMTLQNQTDAGNNKAQQLLTSLPFLYGIVKNGWVTIPKGTNKVLDMDAGTNYANGLNVDTKRHDQFEGYQLQFTVPMLNVNLPFLSQAIAPPDGGQDFRATLSSFLTREPNFTECSQYLGAAYGTLLTKGYSVPGTTTPPTVIIDNGC